MVYKIDFKIKLLDIQKKIFIHSYLIKNTYNIKLLKCIKNNNIKNDNIKQMHYDDPHHSKR